MNKPIKLIYILGTPHSGSTLTDLILGSHSRVESGGEIKTFRDFFESSSRRLKEKRICTCRVDLDDCHYWVRVRRELEVLCGRSDLDLESENQREFEQNNYFFMKAILNITGKEVFCDSSKNYSRLKKFMKSNLFDVTIVHIVRDGRAVAFSRQRKALKKGKTLENEYYQRLKAWLKSNLRLHSKLSHLDNYVDLRYEDLVQNPHQYTSKILERVNLEFEPHQLQFWKFTHHNLSGNRMRKKDNNEISLDRSYLENLSHTEWWLGSIFSFSGLRLFGYPLSRKVPSQN